VLTFERPENGTLRIPNQSFFCGTKGANCQVQGPANASRTIRIEPDPGFMLEQTTCGSSNDDALELVLEKSRGCRVSFVKDLNAPPVGPSHRQPWTNPRDRREMVWIAPPPKGQFLMGSPRTEQGRQSNEDGGPFPFALTSGFWMDVKEVTRAAFSRFDKAPRSGNPDLPMTMVTWEEAANYCRWAGGRLPTEPEWEFAARAEGRFAYTWGSDAIGVLPRFANNTGSPEPVGRRNPNPFDLYDMAGNAAEWTQSPYRPYPLDASTAADKRVVRGGSFGDPSEKLRIASREAFATSERSERIGFRCARQ
jgi:formylglycine-generating enzyme required for sulfatase activity